VVWIRDQVFKRRFFVAFFSSFGVGRRGRMKRSREDDDSDDDDAPDAKRQRNESKGFEVADIFVGNDMDETTKRGIKEIVNRGLITIDLEDKLRSDPNNEARVKPNAGTSLPSPLPLPLPQAFLFLKSSSSSSSSLQPSLTQNMKTPSITPTSTSLWTTSSKRSRSPRSN